ncbi:S41 family peptidase [Ignavibacteriales bacterium]
MKRNLFNNKSEWLIIVVAVILSLGAYSALGDIYFEIGKNIDIFSRVYKEITLNYVDEINPEEFIRAGIRGMLKELDPYTTFIDEKRQDDIELMTKGKYGGIGITVGIRGENVLILEIMDGYAAQKQGLLPGDALHEVAGKSVSPSNYDEISKLVKGAPGTFVELKVRRGEPSDTLSFTLMREEIVVKNVSYAGFVPENSSNAYIKLSGFTRTAGEELRAEIVKLNSVRKIESVVLDLRGNPGGLLDMAIDVSNKFLDKGNLIVTTKGRDSVSIRKFFAEQEPMLGKVEMAVLIDEGSASASEIVAGALQDYDRAVLIGEKSFGKGLVQTITSLSFNTSLKITTSRYYTPSGRSIQKVDYASKNRVIGKHDSVLTAKYYTKNNRLVYSGGGIVPDSMVIVPEKSDLLKDILAKGLVFEFVNSYYEKHKAAQFNEINNEKLFAEFREFLDSKKYKFKHPKTTQLEELMKTFGQDKNYVHLQLKFDELTKEIGNISKDILRLQKDEIVSELLVELSGRYHNSGFRIRYKLINDLQFKTALDIINNKQLYRKILAIN